MAFWEKETIPTKKEYPFYQDAKATLEITEQFNGQVETKEVRIPKDLGEEHPFDYKLTEGLYLNFGFVTGVIDKIVDFCWGPGFYTKSADKRAKAIIDTWLEDTNFDSQGRRWLKEALIKGTGFLELGGAPNEPPQGIKLLNADYMYIKRNKFGVIEGFNQYVGGFKNGTAYDKTSVIPFKLYQIAELQLNHSGDSAYGYGIVYPALQSINNLIQNEKDMHTLMSRKAGAPIVMYMGNRDKDDIPTQSDIDAVGQKLTYMTNKTEWVLGDNMRAEVLDFGNFAEKFATVLDHDLDMLFFTFQVPEVLMGRGSIPEGLAKVQMDAFERRIKSIQVELEKVIENKIFKRILLANGLDVHVELEWGQPSQDERNTRITALTALLQNVMLSPVLRLELEKQLADLMGIDVKLIIPPEVEREEEEEEPQPKVPMENESEHVHESLEDENKDYELKEWLRFDYQQYKDYILTIAKTDPFNLLRATTQEEFLAGKFSDTQVRKLQKVMAKGFQNGESVRTISSNIKKNVKPRDLYVTQDGKIQLDEAGNPRLASSAAFRPVMIARSEATRIANLGSRDFYKDKNVEKYRWLAALSQRTCPECEGLNGQVYDINSNVLPPLHTACRCSIVPVTLLDDL